MGQFLHWSALLECQSVRVGVSENKESALVCVICVGKQRETRHCE